MRKKNSSNSQENPLAYAPVGTERIKKNDFEADETGQNNRDFDPVDRSECEEGNNCY